MGSRGRSVRRLIYLLVAVPLSILLGFAAWVATTSIHNAQNLGRAPALINATSLPTARFVNLLQEERLAAVTYLFNPTATGAAAAFDRAKTGTVAGEPAFGAAMDSSATKGSETPAEAKAIAVMQAQLGQLAQLEGTIGQGQVTPVQAFGAYTKAIVNEPTLFLDEADSMTNATAADQAVGLIAAVSAREQLSEEDALLSGMLVAPKGVTTDQRTVFAQARAAFNIAAANRQAETLDANSILSPANLAVYNASLKGTAPLQQQLSQIEEEIATGTPIDKLGLTPEQWNTLAGSLLTAQYQGGVADANAQLIVDEQIKNSAWVRVGYVGGIGVGALLITFVISTLLGRSIIRRLRQLEDNALTLAEKQLPEVIGRLRRGDDVDVATEAPPLRIGDDEIGRVGQAFDLVRQTAIRSAVEEAKLRRGINDVFRSLARRSQSLLHRQLTLLDQMERRATDPEALDDLFRLDHLTTRMRRHAEGLVILAGAPPGRGWSSPVRMVDVMRGAIAEVEDYARVSVATRSQAALSGSAVADVIHLLAELIENATTLSPPYTSVRVSGDTVANGFAIAVEDRGLGMSPQRISELNDRLANPPEFNPSDSEQLGLFVVSQLARRHGIKITLKSSPYGGTEAVVLVPRHLVVTEEAFRASLPGEPAAAITMGPAPAPPGHVDVIDSLPSAPVPRLVPLDGQSQLLGGPLTADGPRIAGPLRRSQSGGFTEGMPRGGHHAAPRGAENGLASVPGAANGNGLADGNGLANGHGAISGNGVTSGNGFTAEAGPDLLDDGELPRRTRTGPDRAGPDRAGPAAPPGTGGQAAFDAFNPVRRGEREQGTTAPYPGAFPGQPPPRQAWPGQGGPATPAPPPATTPTTQTTPTTPTTPTQATPTMPASPSPAGPASQPSPASPTGPAGPTIPEGWTNPAGPATTFTSVASAPDGDTVARPPWELSPAAGPRPGPGTVPAEVEPEPPDGEGQAAGDFEDLPRRVKQASIAPQLRGDPGGRRQRPETAEIGAGTAGASSMVAGPTPDEIRATMSALQRGWQEGRAQRPGGGEPPWEQNSEGDSDAT